MRKVSVVGGGRFGIAIAFAISQNNQNFVNLHSRNEELVNFINHNGATEDLPNLNLGIFASSNFEEVIKESKYIFLTVPSKVTIEVIEKIAKCTPQNAEGQCIVICSKGLCQGRDLFWSNVIRAKLPKTQFCILSGPSFASEIINEVSTTISVASETSETTQDIQDIFASSKITIVPSLDLNGLQLLGAFKNIIGVRTGVEEGFVTCIEKKIPEQKQVLECKNKIAILTTMLVQECRLAMSQLGCKEETIFSPAGLGDIFLTCSSFKSRNRIFGQKLGYALASEITKNKSYQEILEIGKEFIGNQSYTQELSKQKSLLLAALEAVEWESGTVEGVDATLRLGQYCVDKGIDLPELNSTYRILLKYQRAIANQEKR